MGQTDSTNRQLASSHELDAPVPRDKMLPESQSPDDGRSIPPVQPPLRIAHLLLWTACAAFFLVSCRWFDTFGPPVEIDGIVNLYRVVASLVYGAALSGVFIFVKRRWMGGPAFPVLPGHWLLLICGLYLFVKMPELIVLSELDKQMPGIPEYELLLLNLTRFGYRLLTYGVPAWLYGLAARRSKTEHYWLSLFWTQCGLYVLGMFSVLTAFLPPFLPTVAMQLLGGAEQVASLVLFVWLTVALVWDRCRHVRRDWLHWTGITVVLSEFLLHHLVALARSLFG